MDYEHAFTVKDSQTVALEKLRRDPNALGHPGGRVRQATILTDPIKMSGMLHELLAELDDEELHQFIVYWKASLSAVSGSRPGIIRVEVVEHPECRVPGSLSTRAFRAAKRLRNGPDRLTPDGTPALVMGNRT